MQTRYKLFPASTCPPALERALLDALDLVDEAGVDAVWSQASQQVKHLVERPAKRLRAALVQVGWQVARGESAPVPEAVLDFAAAFELLHAFMLIHDDVADNAPTRRGGRALHHQLGDGKLGLDLAVVAGDHLFARAIERMLGCGLSTAPAATAWLMGICRHTAVGQFLDLSLAQTPLHEVTLFQVLRVATLKTARYSFAAPLVCGAMLAGDDASLRETLGRVGRHAGVAFQLRDDLLGLFGDGAVLGKSGTADFVEGKRTFPVIAAWTRADEAGRARLEALWSAPHKDAALCREASAEVERHGGRRATLRAIERATRAAHKALAALPPGPGRQALGALLLKAEVRS